MVRWNPGARERLQAAALDLFAEEGFEATTVAEISRRTGLTERTFYRYFSDKREVLFDGSPALQERMLRAVVDASDDALPLAIVGDVLDAAAESFPSDRREYSSSRQAIIEATPSLQERELLKLSSLTAALAAAVRSRGVAEPRASLTASAAVSVFQVAFDVWRAPGETRALAEVQREMLASWRDLAGEVQDESQ